MSTLELSRIVRKSRKAQQLRNWVSNAVGLALFGIVVFGIFEIWSTILIAIVLE